MSRPTRDERGATAVLVAILSLVLFGVAAIVVDIGNAWAKRALLQTNVDTAVLAAAQELTEPGGSDGDCSPEVIAEATSVLIDGEDSLLGPQDVNLSDDDAATGSISCDGNWRVTLQAPYGHVTYGLGVLSTEVGHEVGG